MRFRTLLAPAIAVLLMAGCDGLADLEVENLNDPDVERALADPDDVVSLIGSSYLQWWYGAHEFGGGPALSVAADAHSASWGNFAMQDFGTEPRMAINNNPSYGYAYAIEDPWYQNYAALKAANDGIRAIDGLGGGEPVDVGGDETMARAFAKFVQGISHGQLAMLYDQAFIFDETIGPDEIDAGLEMVPYTDVMNAAIGFLNDAIDIASTGTFTLPNAWIQDEEVDDQRLIALAHSYAARYMASVARTPTEAAAVDWATVRAHAEQGITEEFGPTADLNFVWWDALKAWGGVYAGWGRLDLRFLGMGDTSGEYQAWMGTPVQDRQPFLISTTDGRVAGDTPDSDGAYVQYYSTIPFRPERGTYFFSNYGDMRWTWDWECDDPDEVDVVEDPCDWAAYHFYAGLFNTPIPDFMPQELWALIAESHIWEGNPDLAVPFINATRADWLPEVTAAGVPDAADCVPMEPSSTAECGSLLTALHWEKWLNIYHTGMGVEYADARRWGYLVSGTPLHLPVPGSELQVLQLPIYTFGGGGEGSAP